MLPAWHHQLTRPWDLRWCHLGTSICSAGIDAAQRVPHWSDRCHIHDVPCPDLAVCAGAGTRGRALSAGERRLEGSDRALLAYGRRLLGEPDAAALPVGRGILAYGRRLQSLEPGMTQGADVLDAGASSSR